MLKISLQKFIDFEDSNDPIGLFSDSVNHTLLFTDRIGCRSDIFFRQTDRFGETVDYKSGNVITVLGCHGTDPELAASYADWQFYLQQGAPDYPTREAIQTLACARGARVA